MVSAEINLTTSDKPEKQDSNDHMVAVHAWRSRPRGENERLIAEYFPDISPSRYPPCTAGNFLDEEGFGSISYGVVSTRKTYTKYFRKFSQTGVSITRDAETEQLLCLEDVYDKKSTTVYFVDKNGKPYSHPHLVDYERGKLIRKGELKDDTLHGFKFAYHDNGAYKLQKTVVGDVLHGYEKAFDEQGRYFSKEHFVDGVSTGYKIVSNPETGRPVYACIPKKLGNGYNRRKYDEVGHRIWQGHEENGIVFAEYSYADKGKTIIGSKTRKENGMIDTITRLDHEGVRIETVRDGKLIGFEEMMACETRRKLEEARMQEAILKVRKAQFALN